MNQNADPYAKVEPELLPGEELLWAGQPTPRHLAFRNSPLAPSIGIGLGMLFAGLLVFAIFFMMAMTRMGPGLTGPMPVSPPLAIFAPILIVFLIVGLRFLAAPLWNYFRATGTTYAITNRRLMIISGGLSTTVTSYGVNDIERVERRSHRDGTGDIIFRYETRTRWDSDMSGPGRRHRHAHAYTVPIGFFGIADSQTVEALLLDTFMPKGRRYGGDEETPDDAVMIETLMQDAAGHEKPKRQGE